MLLEEITLAPPKVIGAQFGKLFVELAKLGKEAILKQDPKAFYTVQAGFDTEQIHFLFFFTFSEGAKRSIPTIRAGAKALLKTLKLDGFKMNYGYTLEDVHSRSINVIFDLTDYLKTQDDKQHSGDAFDRLSDAAVAAFKAGIGDIDHQIHS